MHNKNLINLNQMKGIFYFNLHYYICLVILLFSQTLVFDKTESNLNCNEVIVYPP